MQKMQNKTKKKQKMQKMKKMQKYEKCKKCKKCITCAQIPAPAGSFMTVVHGLSSRASWGSSTGGLAAAGFFLTGSSSHTDCHDCVPDIEHWELPRLWHATNNESIWAQARRTRELVLGQDQKHEGLNRSPPGGSELKSKRRIRHVP